MSAAWAEGLKVVELKEELKKRGLPVSGKKAELIERLVSSLDQDDKAEAAQPEAQEEPHSAVGDAEGGAAAADANRPAGDSKDISGPVNEVATTQAAAVDGSHTEYQQNESVAAQQDRSPKREPQQVAAMPANRSDPASEAASTKKDLLTVDSILEPEADMPVDYGEMEADVEHDQQKEPIPAPQAEHAATKAQPARSDGGSAQQQVVEEPKAQAPVAAQATPSSSAAPAEPASAAPGTGKRKRAPIPDFQPRDKASTPAGTTPTLAKRPSIDAASLPEKTLEVLPNKLARTGSALTSPRQAIPSPAATEAKRVVPLAKGSPTRALRIDGLVRPFTEGQLRELLSQTGTILDLWMPSIKTHCFVIFESEEQAEATRQAVHGLKWPKDSPKVLLPQFLTLEDAEAEIATGKQGSGGFVRNAVARAAPQAAAATALAAAAATAATQAVPVHRDSGSLNALKTASSAPLESRPVARQESQPLPQRDAQPQHAADKHGTTPAPASDAQPPSGEMVLHLDDLFHSTKTMPKLYYLPLTDEQVAEKKRRAAEMAKHTEAENGRLPPPPLLDSVGNGRGRHEGPVGGYDGDWKHGGHGAADPYNSRDRLRGFDDRRGGRHDYERTGRY